MRKWNPRRTAETTPCSSSMTDSPTRGGSMEFDAESRNANQPRAEGPASPPSVGRVARPLGRGLEDVSHLFLPRTTEVRAGEPTGGQASERVPVRPGARAGAA